VISDEEELRGDGRNLEKREKMVHGWPDKVEATRDPPGLGGLLRCWKRDVQRARPRESNSAKFD
jgi:hypothetical protein